MEENIWKSNDKELNSKVYKELLQLIKQTINNLI